MSLSLNTPGAPPVASSVNQPLQPMALSGWLGVDRGEVPNFLQGFPTPPGVPDVIAGINKGAAQVARGFRDAVESGDVQRVVMAAGQGLQRALPVAAGLLGAGVSLSGVVAGVAGPILGTLIPQPYGAAVGTVLEVYAPLASVGGQAIAGLSSVAAGTAAMAQRAADAARQQSAIQAAGG